MKKSIVSLIAVASCVVVLVGGCSKQETHVGYRIDRDAVNKPEWQKKIAELEGHLGGEQTLMRVLLEGADADQAIQLTGKNVKGTEKLSQGKFRQIRNGDFAILVHVVSSKRKNGKDPVRIGTFTHYNPTVWIKAPSEGGSGYLGDVIIFPYPEEQKGRISATVRNESGKELKTGKLLYGPVAVGGPYGLKADFNADKVAETGLLSPGSYKLLLPGFDYQKSRWTVEVAAGKTTEVVFTATSQKEVKKTKETLTPR